jgi:uroporphyrinogen-III synthase
VSCGGGTSQELRAIGLRADIEPASDFGADSLIEDVLPLVTPGLRVLRMRSDKAGAEVADALRAHGAAVDDCVLYTNEAIPQGEAPLFDDVFFASASAVEAFAGQWGMERLAGKTVVAIGKPTLAALKQRGRSADLVGPEATVESSLTALALECVRRALRETLAAAANSDGRNS